MNTEASLKKNTLAKEERLYSTKSIDKLFSSGESFVAYPLRIVYLIEDETCIDKQIVSILVSVSKKKFKRAVKRNRVKRLVKEAYRLNKGVYQDLLHSGGKRIGIAFLYLKNELPVYAEIEKAILKTAAVLSERLKGGKP
ncbi:ribonuclease P protein component [Dysgonomonas termitidis]|jgi:ribonuclease P protein component|uniref:Ribonuclease P protein component n=1 Tax=Dysgonomonas termitidis TaxID=1516126 RepID=A0ABV9L163_9BACT